MNTEHKTRTFESFITPELTDIRKKYVAVPSKETREGWPQIHVKIFRNNPDGSQDEVFEYNRNYSFLKTFEPFRHLVNGEWGDYALISSSYTRFEVVDLNKGEIVAVEPYPTITEETHERWRKQGREDWCEKEPVGTEKPGLGFCPMEFYVPNLYDELITWLEEGEEPTEQNLKAVLEQGFQAGDSFHYYINESHLNLLTGQYAFYSGCVWGDDSSSKLNWIDLSRLSEGVVSSDPHRFGYVPLFFQEGDTLKDVVRVEEGGLLQVSCQLTGNVKTPGFYNEGINWKDS